MSKCEFLGELGDKEYYLDLRPTLLDSHGQVIANPTYKKIVWRIPDLREAVHAPPGFKILSSDYSQVEVKLMAHLSGDPWLKQAINSGKDIHCYMAVDCYGTELKFSYEEINSARKDETHLRYHELVPIRNRIKRVTFGVPYGAGPDQIAFLTGQTREEAVATIERYFSKAKVLKQWLMQQGSNAVHDGYSTSPRGRKRFYRLPNPSDPEMDMLLGQIKRWAGNHPIQAGNVDMLKPAMKMIYDGLRREQIKPIDSRLLFVVHDEVVMIARDQYVEVVQSLMKESMQTTYANIIPDIVNKIDVVVSDVWAKA